MKTDKHTFWMVIGCVLPLILVFLAPAFGILNNTTLFIYLAAMFALHLLMPMHNHKNQQHNNNKNLNNDGNKTSKNNNHEQHQH